MDERNWTPGHPGKGALIKNGDVITWNYSGDMDDAQHWDVLEGMGYDYYDSLFNFYIEPDGVVQSMEGEVNADTVAQLERAGLDVRDLSVHTWEGWTSKTASNLLNWDEGQYGRGIVTEDRTVHTFDSEEYYNHADYEIAHGLNNVVCRFGIQPDGTVLNADVLDIHPIIAEIIEEADPRLHVSSNSEMTWQG